MVIYLWKVQRLFKFLVFLTLSVCPAPTRPSIIWAMRLPAKASIPQVPWRSVASSGNSPFADNLFANAAGHRLTVSPRRPWCNCTWPGRKKGDERERHAIKTLKVKMWTQVCYKGLRKQRLRWSSAAQELRVARHCLRSLCPISGGSSKADNRECKRLGLTWILSSSAWTSHTCTDVQPNPDLSESTDQNQIFNLDFFNVKVLNLILLNLIFLTKKYQRLDLVNFRLQNSD
jgi:hypothetical protein